MDPLVGTVIGIVSPYLVKGAEEFAKSAGSAAFEGAKAIVTRLSQWWSAEPVADAAAKALPSNPERYGKILGDQLADELEKNPTFAAELRGLVDGMGPSVEVVQKMEVARGVTGADIGTLLSGTVRVQQEIRDAQNVTGFKADKVGGR
jgi:hypothetical protein